MARVVVVASSEPDRETLREVVSADDELVVLVPAVEQSRLDWRANDENEARDRADHVGDAIDRRAPASASVVEVRAEHPGQLVLDAVAEHSPDRVVLALRDDDDATWLAEGELETIPSSVNGVPVIHVRL
jgi:hypothetical protein